MIMGFMMGIVEVLGPGKETSPGNGVAGADSPKLTGPIPNRKRPNVQTNTTGIFGSGWVGAISLRD